MTNENSVEVSRRSLTLQLVMYVISASTSGALVLYAIRDITSFAVGCALSFLVSGLFLFPAFRIWKESRRRNTPSFARFLLTAIPLAVVIFIMTSVVR